MSSPWLAGSSTLLAIGVMAALATVVWARRKGPRVEPLRWATVLVAMQAIYVGFAVTEPSLRALGIELVLLALFSGIASRIWKGFPLLLPLGYLLHGAWDVGHHITASPYVPSSYPELCVAYDWFLTVYFVTRLRAWSEQG